MRENAVTVNGTIHVGSPTTNPIRSVPYPEFIDPMLRRLTAGKPADALLFGKSSAMLSIRLNEDSSTPTGGRFDGLDHSERVHPLLHQSQGGSGRADQVIVQCSERALVSRSEVCVGRDTDEELVRRGLLQYSGSKRSKRRVVGRHDGAPS